MGNQYAKEVTSAHLRQAYGTPAAAATPTLKPALQSPTGGMAQYKHQKNRDVAMAAAKKAKHRFNAGIKLGSLVGNRAALEQLAERAVVEARNRYNGAPQLTQDGMLNTWRHSLKLTEVETKAVVNVGSGRLQRVWKGEGKKACGGRQNDPNVLKDADRHHIRDLVRYNQNEASILGHDLEPGMPCNHKPLQYYFPEGVNLTSLFKLYKLDVAKTTEIKAVDYSYFTRMFKFYHKQVKATRRSEDVCDVCTRLKILLQDSTLSEEARAELKLSQSVHQESARTQRRIVTAVCQEVITQYGPGQRASIDLDVLLTPEASDDAVRGANPTPIKVQVNCEDFAGASTLPYLQQSRASIDFWTSDISIRNMVISDMNTGELTPTPTPTPTQLNLTQPRPQPN
jgi:hypothetical protein